MEPNAPPTKPHVSADLVELVRKMRTQQRIFFSPGKMNPLKSMALVEAKKLEKEVDQFIKLYDEAMHEYELHFPPVNDGGSQPSLLDALPTGGLHG